MGYSVILPITALSLLFGVACAAVAKNAIEYPPARRDDNVEEEFYGTKVSDPYRWLERPNSNEVAEFVDAQNDLAFNQLADCPDRQQIRERLTELWKYPKYGKPEKRGSRYFYYAQESGKEVLMVQDSRDAEPRPLLDSEETGAMIFPYLGTSINGEVLVFREVIKRKSGSPKITGNLRIKNVTNDQLFPDLIEDVVYPKIVYVRDSSGFFYLSHRRINEPPPEDDEGGPIIYIYFHRIGTLQSQDVLVFDLTDFHKQPAKSVQMDMDGSEDGNHLLLRPRVVEEGPEARRRDSIYLGDLREFESKGYNQKLRLRLLQDGGSKQMKYVTNVGNRFYFRSRSGAKNYRLVEITLPSSTKEPSTERVVVAENPNYVLQSASAVAPNNVLLGYMSESSGSYAELRDLSNGSLIRMFPLKYGELISFSSQIGDTEVLFRSQTLEGLPQLSTLDTSQEKSTFQPLVQSPPLTSYDPALFTTTKVTFPSQNQSEEMVIIHRKDLKMDGSSYALLVEREFDIDFYFRMFFSYMKDYNAIIAIPNVQDADGTYKDAALDDFIAASKYLIDNGYTSSSKLVSRGTNVFGLFVAAAANRNPELYGAIVPYMVGFDMVRFPTFSNWSVAAKPSDQETFLRLLRVSPLHNIRLPVDPIIQYPAVFVPTPDNEFPVIFAFKYIAELQYRIGRSSRQRNPILLRVVSEPSESLRNYARYHIERETDIRCFLGKAVGLRLSA